MLKEDTIEIEGRTYTMRQLPLEKSQEVLVKLLSLLGGADGIEENILATLPSRLRVDDLNFFRARLFGENLLYTNENGAQVPMGKALVESHFAGRIGLMLHLLAKCIMHNFSDFLADLRLDELTGASIAE